MKPGKHGRDHLWTGEDPVAFETPMIVAQLTSQSITVSTEAQWGSAFTNRPDMFEWDSDDPGGLLVKLPGTFRFCASMEISSAASTLRDMSIQGGVLSGGPLGGTAIRDVSGFSSYTWPITAASHAAVPTANSWEISVRAFNQSVPAVNPLRFAMVIAKLGGNFNLTFSQMSIEWLGRVL